MGSNVSESRSVTLTRRTRRHSLKLLGKRAHQGTESYEASANAGAFCFERKHFTAEIAEYAEKSGRRPTARNMWVGHSCPTDYCLSRMLVWRGHSCPRIGSSPADRGICGDDSSPLMLYARFPFDSLALRGRSVPALVPLEGARDFGMTQSQWLGEFVVPMSRKSRDMGHPATWGTEHVVVGHRSLAKN